ncbi:hypothetical protein C8J57DRAFT_1348559, partial [Mycena rebaudengoi]
VVEVPRNHDITDPCSVSSSTDDRLCSARTHRHASLFQWRGRRFSDARDSSIVATPTSRLRSLTSPTDRRCARLCSPQLWCIDFVPSPPAHCAQSHPVCLSLAARDYRGCELGDSSARRHGLTNAPAFLPGRRHLRRFRTVSRGSLHLSSATGRAR